MSWLRRDPSAWILLLLSGATLVSVELILETTRYREPWSTDCETLSFRPEQFLSCLCLTGLHAFKISKVGGVLPEWRLFGAEEEACFPLGEWVKEITRISEDSKEPSIFKMGPSNSFAVAGIQDWQGEVLDRFRNKVSYCLRGAPTTDSYCTYNIKSPEKLDESRFRPGCSYQSTLINPVNCHSFTPQTNSSKSEVCYLVPPVFEDPSPRLKRATVPNGTDFEEEGGENSTEIDPEKIKGNPEMMKSISIYVKNQVETIIRRSLPDAKLEFNPFNLETPAKTLLKKCGMVAKKICNPIPEDIFDMVVNSFLVMQKRNYLKDPYIAYPTYDRVLEAICRCEMEAQPIIFVPNDTIICPTELPRDTSGIVKSQGGNESLGKLPDYAIAKPDAFELVVEMMWKTFLMTHSYCFKYFKSYFNDHHAFTTTLIPFFTNRIQETWILEGGGDKGSEAPAEGAAAEEANYTSDSIWYGNFLGNVSKLFQDVDRCYSASRLIYGSDTPKNYYYPWFLRRPNRDPTNEWVQGEGGGGSSPPAEGARRKRDGTLEEEDTCEIGN